MRADLIPFLAVAPQVFPEWLDGAPGALYGFGFALFLGGWFWVHVIRPVILRRNGETPEKLQQIERMKRAADALERMERHNERMEALLSDVQGTVEDLKRLHQPSIGDVLRELQDLKSEER